MTWQDVQKKLIEVQSSHQMCIHKKELTELGKHDVHLSKKYLYIFKYYNNIDVKFFF